MILHSHELYSTAEDSLINKQTKTKNKTGHTSCKISGQGKDEAAGH